MAFEDARTAGLRGVVAGLSAMLALNAPQQASAQEVFAISLVTPGMNRTELTSVMGPPSYIQVKERREAWQYCPPRSFVRFIDDVLRRERLYVTVWLNRGRVEPDNRGHRSDTDWNGFLHIRTAASHRSHGIRKIQDAGGNQSRVLTQTVPCDNGRNRYALGTCSLIRGNRHRQNRGLRIRGQLQVSLVARKAHLGQRESKRVVRLFKYLA